MTGLQKQLQTDNPYPLGNSGAICRSLLFFIGEFFPECFWTLFQDHAAHPKAFGEPFANPLSWCSSSCSDSCWELAQAGCWNQRMWPCYTSSLSLLWQPEIQVSPWHEVTWALNVPLVLLPWLGKHHGLEISLLQEWNEGIFKGITGKIGRWHKMDTALNSTKEKKTVFQ